MEISTQNKNLCTEIRNGNENICDKKGKTFIIDIYGFIQRYMHFFVSDWLIETNLNPDFEDTSTEELNKLLRRFYGEVQPKKGHHY